MISLKKMVFVIGFVFYTTIANANHSGVSESTTAEDAASCNAAFNTNCPLADLEDQSYTASSGGFAAPAGALGNSPLELAFIGLISSVLICRRPFYHKLKNRLLAP